MTKKKSAKSVRFAIPDETAFLDQLIAENAELKAKQDALDAEEAKIREHAEMLLQRKIAREKLLRSAKKVVADPHLTYSSTPNNIAKGIF